MFSCHFKKNDENIHSKTRNEFVNVFVTLEFKEK